MARPGLVTSKEPAWAVTVQLVAGIHTFPLVSSVRTSRGRRPCLAAMAMAKKFADGPPLTLAAAKPAIDEGLDLTLPEGRRWRPACSPGCSTPRTRTTACARSWRTARARPPSPVAEVSPAGHHTFVQLGTHERFGFGHDADAPVRSGGDSGGSDSDPATATSAAEAHRR